MPADACKYATDTRPPETGPHYQARDNTTCRRGPEGYCARASTRKKKHVRAITTSAKFDTYIHLHKQALVHAEECFRRCTPPATLLARAEQLWLKANRSTMIGAGEQRALTCEHWCSSHRPRASERSAASTTAAACHGRHPRPRRERSRVHVMQHRAFRGASTRPEEGAARSGIAR